MARHPQVRLQAGLVAQQPARVEDELAFVIHGLASRLQPAQDCLLPGGVRVERQHDACA